MPCTGDLLTSRADFQILNKKSTITRQSEVEVHLLLVYNFIGPKTMELAVDQKMQVCL